ncbi:MAG: hypothetical protein JWN14_2463, partial [Chthonomonadales bacterium]|nr:hypothetical protein [Chthonomonadales bacterium]
MARVNPMILPRPTRQVVYRQITDGRNVADFWLRARDATEDFQGLELIKEKVKLYITGDRQKDKDPVPFPPVGGEAVVKLSEALF